MILQHGGKAFFTQFGSYIWKYGSHLHENYTTDVSLETKEAPLSFGNHRDPNVDPEFRTGFTLGMFAVARGPTPRVSEISSLL